MIQSMAVIFIVITANATFKVPVLLRFEWVMVLVVQSLTWFRPFRRARSFHMMEATQQRLQYLGQAQMLVLMWITNTKFSLLFGCRQNFKLVLSSRYVLNLQVCVCVGTCSKCEDKLKVCAGCRCLQKLEVWDSCVSTAESSSLLQVCTGVQTSSLGEHSVYVLNLEFKLVTNVNNKL